MKNKLIGVTLISVMIFQSLSFYVNAVNLLPYSDVNENNWYYNYLYNLTTQNVINGFTDGTFRGNSELYKNQILKMLVASVRPNADYSIPEEEINEIGQVIEYPKVNWFKPYLDKARELGIVEEFVPKYKEYDGPLVFDDGNGNIIDYSNVDKELLRIYEEEDINEKFNISITRGEVATYTYKAYIIDKYISAAEEDYTDAKAIEYLKSKYNDFNLIPKDKYKEIYFLNLWEIMQGDTNGNFNPNGKLTRAEATAIVSRVLMNRFKLRISGMLNEYNVEELDKN